MKLKRFTIGLIYFQRRFFHGVVLRRNTVLSEVQPSLTIFMATYRWTDLWHSIGHMPRRDRKNVARQALNYRPQGKSKVGGPRNNWRQSMLQELERVNYSSPGREHQQTTTEGTDVLCSSGTDKD